MRRAPYVGAVTVAGLIGVLSYHTKSPIAAPVTSRQSGEGTSPNSTQGGGTPATTPATTPASSTPPNSAVPPKSSPTTSSTPPTTLPPTSTSTSTTAPATVSTATGALEQYGYGQLSVEVTVSANRIEAVSVPDLQTAEQYSQQLAQQAIPMLRSEVLQAQNAQINGVSGATYTSQAYALSLQSALDKLHFR